MVGRILPVALAAILVVTSVPASVFAEQPAGATTEQSERAQCSVTTQRLEGTSGVFVYGDLPQTAHPLDLQNATRRIVLPAQTPRRHTLRQTTSGGRLESRGTKVMLYVAVIAGAALAMYAIEGAAPTPTPATAR